MNDLDDDYRGAGFSGQLVPGQRPALLLVDVVQAYLLPDSPLYAGVEAAVEGCRRLLAEARAAGILRIFTRVVYQPGGADGGVFYRKVPSLKCFDEGAPTAAFAPGLEPQAGEVLITKQYASAFFGTTLAATLTSQGVDTLLIAGLSTSGCVRATAVDACQYGFIPLVVREAVGDRDVRPHEANLFDLQAKYAEVVNETAVVDYLRTCAR